MAKHLSNDSVQDRGSKVLLFRGIGRLDTLMLESIQIKVNKHTMTKSATAKSHSPAEFKLLSVITVFETFKDTDVNQKILKKKLTRKKKEYKKRFYKSDVVCLISRLYRHVQFFYLFF